MKPIIVLYATWDGHTRKVAEHVHGALYHLGYASEIANVKRVERRFDFERYAGVILAASVHLGRHEREMVSFARANRNALDGLPTLFFSLSVSEAGSENPVGTEDDRTRAAADVEAFLAKFVADTGWRPALVKPLGGALLYTHHGRVLQFFMKILARNAGLSTDTSRDHVFTNWHQLDAAIEAFVRPLGRPALSPTPDDLGAPTAALA